MEEESVIAKIHAKKKKGNEIITEIEYIDNAAKSDVYAQEIIAEGIEDIKETYQYVVK